MSLKRLTFPLEEVIAASEEGTGFCFACGETQSGVEPDGREYACESCGAEQVFGAEEVLLQGRAV